MEGSGTGYSSSWSSGSNALGLMSSLLHMDRSWLGASGFLPSALTHATRGLPLPVLSMTMISACFPSDRRNERLLELQPKRLVKPATTSSRCGHALKGNATMLLRFWEWIRPRELDSGPASAT